MLAASWLLAAELPPPAPALPAPARDRAGRRRRSPRRRVPTTAPPATSVSSRATRSAAARAQLIAPPSREGTGGTAAGPSRRRRTGARRKKKPAKRNRKPAAKNATLPPARANPSKSARSRARAAPASGVPPVLIPIYQRAAATYGLGPQGAAVLAGINEIETAFGTNLNTSYGRGDGLDAVHPVDLGNVRRRRQRRRGQGPLQPRRRDLRRGPLPERRRHARRHLRRDLLLQPRRLVRRRGARKRRLLRRRRRRSAAGGGLLAHPPARSPDLHARPPTGATPFPPNTWKPSRPPPPATNSADEGVWALAAVARLESELRPRHDQGADAEAGRSASTRPSGAPTRSTATKTGTSGTPTRPTRPRRWPG